MVRPVELVLTGVTGPTPSSTTLKNQTSFFYTIGATFGSFIVPFFLLRTLEESFVITLASFLTSFLASFLAFFLALIYTLASFTIALYRALSAFSASFRALLAANLSFLITFRAFLAISLASYFA
jgi:hypothetical protein